MGKKGKKNIKYRPFSLEDGGQKNEQPKIPMTVETTKSVSEKQFDSKSNQRSRENSASRISVPVAKSGGTWWHSESPTASCSTNKPTTVSCWGSTKDSRDRSNSRKRSDSNDSGKNKYNNKDRDNENLTASCSMNKTTAVGRTSRWDSTKDSRDRSNSRKRSDSNGSNKKLKDDHDFVKPKNEIPRYVPPINTYSNNFNKSSKGFDNKRYYIKQVFREEIGDLFEAPKDFSLCHCVAEDLAMGAGIAVEFRNRFKQIDKLMEQRQKTGGVALLKDEERFIYYLITKQKSNGKPYIEDLRRSLEKMREHMLHNNITKLAMPMIGCGLDRLNWKDVSNLLNVIFENDNFEIVIYKLDENNPVSSSREGLKLAYINYRDHSLIRMESCTLLLFTASTEGEITPEMEVLDKKFHFIPDYRKSRKRTVGDYYFIDIRDEWIVVLYVKDKEKDKFSFVAFVKALQKVIREHKGIKYIGIDRIDDEDDYIFMEKLETLFKYYCRDCQVFICNGEAQ